MPLSEPKASPEGAYTTAPSHSTLGKPLSFSSSARAPRGGAIVIEAAVLPGRAAIGQTARISKVLLDESARGLQGIHDFGRLGTEPTFRGGAAAEAGYGREGRGSAAITPAAQGR